MKTAIVTGAGAGLGKAICQKLSQNNYHHFFNGSYIF